MGTPLPPNVPVQTTDTAIDLAVKAGESIAETAAETALDAAAPVFALPVIKQVTDAFIDEVISVIGGKISVAIQQAGTFLIIDTQVSSEEGGISQALANLMVAEKSGNPAQIQAAIAAYEKAQSALVNDDGATTPTS